MIISTETVKQITISGVPGLDAIRAITENYGPGQGRITITCYGRAWSAAWFSMGKNTTIEQFITECDDGYILSNLTFNMAPRLKRNQMSDEAYLTRIILAVQAAMRPEAP